MVLQYPIPLPPRKPDPFTFPGYTGGINISVTPDQIRSNQTPDQLNMNYDDGAVPTKRPGFERVNAASWGAGSIRGMTEWTKPDGTTVFVVAWGGKLYTVVEDGTKTNLCTGTKTSIADAQTNFFEMGDKLFAYTGTDYVYWDGTNPVADVADIAYVPLFTLGRSPDGTTSTANEDLNYLRNRWTDSFSPDGTAMAYQLSYTDLAADAVTGEQDTVSGTVTLVEGTDFTVNRTTGVVTFSIAPAAGTNTVRLTATKDALMDPTKITKCTCHEIYGGKNDIKVFLGGHPDDKNIRYESGLLDPTYWPENNYEYIGNNSEQLTAFGKMIDYLINFKQHSISYSTVDTDTNGNIVFPTYPLNDEYGILASRTVRPANGGLLFLAQNNEGSPAGVAWLTPSLVRGQLNVRIISQDINRNRNRGTVNGILEEDTTDLQAAHAYIYREKYWLHIGTAVWVLDLAYADFANGVFPWYRYDGTPGKAAQYLERADGELYIGDKDSGIIYNSYAQYRDDGEIIDAYWTSPIVYPARHGMLCKFERLQLTFKGQTDSDHAVTFVTDQGKEEVTLDIQAGAVLDYSVIDYGVWTYGVPLYPSTQNEKVGYKGEYLQWRIRNNTIDQGMTILGQSLRWFPIKEVK